MKKIDAYFGITESGSNLRTEIIAGITTFVAMAYIVLVNPSILGQVSGSLHVDKNAALAAITIATCLSAAIGTLLMAFLAKLPFAQAPGMGLNAFFAFTICMGMGYTFQQGLAAVFMSGIIFIIITLFGWREVIVKALPKNLRFAITVGLGFFIAFIGLKNAGIVVNNEATLVGVANFADPKTFEATKGAILAICGVLLIAGLMKWNVKGAILIGIVVCAIVAWPLGIVHPPKNTGLHLSLAPTFLKMDFGGLLHVNQGLMASIGSAVAVVITLTLVDMFDTIGTLVGTANRAGLVDKEGNVKNMNKAMMCDAIATTVGACLGTSTVTTYVESASGVSEGGRTGFASLVTGILLILCIFVAPFVGFVATQATAPALIIVGVLMMSSVKNIDFDDITEALPAFLTIIMMILGYSIATGIAFGIISYPIVKLITGKAKETHWLMYVLAALFIIRFIMI
jgi:Permeases